MTDAVRSPGFRRLLVGGTWAVAVPLVGFALLRLVGVADRSPRLFAIATLTLWILLPAYAVLAVGVATRRRALAATGAGLVLLHLVWVGPDIRWWADGDDRTPATSFVVAAANINAGNTEFDALWASLLEIDADVLALTEVTPAAQRALIDAGIEDEYPHRVDDARSGWFGTAIHSRFPITDGEVLDVVGVPMSRATLAVDDDPVDLVAVHTRQPLSALPTLREQLGVLGEFAASVDGPVVLAGDFNATRQHAPFRALLETGLRDAHHVRGRGDARTWPVGRRMPTFALLDHVLASDELIIHSIREATLPGSDHRAVVSRLSTVDD